MCTRSDDPSTYDEAPAPAPKPWGEVWGAPFVRRSDGATVLMRRKAQRVQFFTQAGEPVGPEHRNVVPALIWAWASGSPLSDPTADPVLMAGIRREIAAGKPERKRDVEAEMAADREDPHNPFKPTIIEGY